MYQHTSQLLALEACVSDSNRTLPRELARVVTPLRLEEWTSELQAHPDQEFAKYILRGIDTGFRVGFNSRLVKLKSRPLNMPSADEHPEVVQGYLQDEVASGRVVLVSQTVVGERNIHASPFGVIPKKSKPNKWRLILDLSSPNGSSVNDGIEKELTSLSYVSVDDVVAQVLRRGRGTMMAKMDIKRAYRNIPVHPNDRLLLGMKWAGGTYVDTTLPFGLRSAPLIFSAVADAMAWIMQQKGVSWVAHYLDDFVTTGDPEGDECGRNADIMHGICEQLGMPVEPEKDEGPATVISFLGLELDSTAMEVRLPLDKLTNLRALLTSWRGRKACKKRELLSLIGSLAHASKAIKPGRSYLRRLINLSTITRRLDQFIRLSREARADIEWWASFASEWNGTAMMVASPGAKPQVILTSDASGTWGCGAFCGDQWFMLPWVARMLDTHITVKELAPIVVAATIWGKDWRGKTVLAQCDNTAVVAIVNSGASRNPEAMQLRRCLAFLEAKREFAMWATHIQGARNQAADALSRNKLTAFRVWCPQARQEESSIPPELLDSLLLRDPNWTCRNWMELWTSSVAKH